MKNILILSFILIVIGCTKNDAPQQIDLGYNYFPTQLGATWIYHVDSIVYDDNSGFTTIDTFTYQYKEQITGNFKDVSGVEGQFVSRYFRENDTAGWVQANTATILLTSLNAQKVVENVRYVKLLFPTAKNKRWDGNAYNSFGEEEYILSQFDIATTVGNTTFEKTLKVLQRDEKNAIEEIKKNEIYARNIGLVYLLSDSINTQVGGAKGYRYRLTLQTFIP